MKITQNTVLAGEETATISRMSKAEQDKLIDLTINEAIKQKLIWDLGDEEGNFIMASGREDIDAHYAVINGKGVPVSSTIHDLMDDPDELAKNLGKLTFSSGTSNKEFLEDGTKNPGFGKAWFNLGAPRGINLTKKGALKLALEPVATGG